MEEAASSSTPATPSRRNNGSGGLLGRLPFLQPAAGHMARHRSSDDSLDAPSSSSATRKTHLPAPPALLQLQPKTRRRRGSLRKVALLGRGAQRKTGGGSVYGDSYGYGGSDSNDGLGISDNTPRPSMDGYASRTVSTTAEAALLSPTPQKTASQTSRLLLQQHDDDVDDDDNSYDADDASLATSCSTTDDEDARSAKTAAAATSMLRQPTPKPAKEALPAPAPAPAPAPLQPAPPPSRSVVSLQALQPRQPARQRAKSPLSLTDLSAATLPADDDDWDYAETEWWGWVMLVVTWVVFVTGMGSCLGVWSWAWDVGTTPYAPPELEDDPTLPIVGYYPALIILTCVMAWVWVVVAWIGMKYFRHAKITGD